MSTLREFADKFDPKPGDYCYQAYKGLEQKCAVCPVEKTFEDGESHWSEESGPDKDKTRRHWLVKTCPIKNSKGDTVAVMEINLDITPRKELEEKLMISENKYHSIFSNIPNPVFVLDLYTLEILDCNESVEAVYGCMKDDVKTKGEFEVDAGVLASALTNILENGMAACIVDESRKAHQIVFGVRQDKDDIIFDVRDNGIGMDRETKEKVFTLFYSSKGREGTGLGLFISNQIIEQHGGSSIYYSFQYFSYARSRPGL